MFLSRQLGEFGQGLSTIFDFRAIQFRWTFYTMGVLAVVGWVFGFEKSEKNVITSDISSHTTTSTASVTADTKAIPISSKSAKYYKPFSIVVSALFIIFFIFFFTRMPLTDFFGSTIDILRYRQVPNYWASFFQGIVSVVLAISILPLIFANIANIVLWLLNQEFATKLSKYVSITNTGFALSNFISPFYLVGILWGMFHINELSFTIPLMIILSLNVLTLLLSKRTGK
jgi:hypothetical protein